MNQTSDSPIWLKQGTQGDLAGLHDRPKEITTERYNYSCQGVLHPAGSSPPAPKIQLGKKHILCPSDNINDMQHWHGCTALVSPRLTLQLFFIKFDFVFFSFSLSSGPFAHHDHLPATSHGQPASASVITQNSCCSINWRKIWQDEGGRGLSMPIITCAFNRSHI